MEKNCKNSFDYYMQHLLGRSMQPGLLNKAKEHVHNCDACRDSFMLLVDIIEEYLMEHAFGQENIKPDTRLSIKKLHYYHFLMIYKKYRFKALSMLGFRSAGELYDFYQDKVIPAFEEAFITEEAC